MAKTISGNINGEGSRFGIVVSRFNHLITDRLLEGALDSLVRHNVEDDDIIIVRVPGAFEVPAAAKQLVASGKVDGVITLAAVIRGQTPHFDLVAAEIAKGVAHVSLESDVPVTFGVLTTDTLEQAVERAGTKAGNKGADAAMATMELVQVYKSIGSIG